MRVGATQGDLKMATKKRKKSSKNMAGKGHIPTEVLEERLQKLNRKVKARGGKHF